MKPISIIYRKLGKHNADGLAWCEDNLIEIDERLKSFQHLETLIHEITHIQNPTWSEIKVDGHSKQLATILWQIGYRKCEL